VICWALFTSQNSYIKKSYLPKKAYSEGLQGVQCFETFTEGAETLVIDVVAAFSKSITV